MSSTLKLKPGETILSEDDDTIVTRTIETRQITQPNPTPITYTTFTSPGTITHTPSSGTISHTPNRLPAVTLTSDPPLKSSSTSSNMRTSYLDTTTNKLSSPSNTRILASKPPNILPDNAGIGITGAPIKSSRVIHSPSRAFPSNSNFSSNTNPTMMSSSSFMKRAAPTMRRVSSPMMIPTVSQGPTVTTVRQSGGGQQTGFITTETITTRKKKKKEQPTNITVQAPPAKNDESLLRHYRQEIERLQRKVDQLQNTINKLNEANAKVYILENTNKDLLGKNNRLEDELANLKAQNESLRVNLAVKENSILNTPIREEGSHYLQSELERLQGEIGIMRREKQAKEEEQLELKEKNIKQGLQLEKSTQDLAEALAKLSNLKGDLKNAQNNISMLNAEKEQLHKQNQMLNDNGDSSKLIDELNRKLSQLARELEEERSKNSRLSHQVDSLHGDKNAHQRLLNDLDAKGKLIEGLRKEISNQANENQNLMIRIEQITSQNPDESNLIEINQKLVEEFDEKTGEYLNKIQEMENLINQLENEKKEILEENEIVKSEFLLLERDYELAKADANNNDTLLLIKEENEGLKRLNEQLRSEMETNRNQSRGPSSEFSELSKKLNDLESRMTRDSSTIELTDLKARNRELEHKIRSYERKEDKWSQLSKDLATIKSGYQEDKMVIMQLNREKNDLENRLRNLENESNQKQQLIEQLETEVDEWRNKCIHLEKRVEYGENENQNLHFIEEIEGLKQTVSEKEQELSLWKREVRDLENELGNLADGEQNIHEISGRMVAMEEEIKNLSLENDQLRAENDQLRTEVGDLNEKFESAEDFVVQNENLRELLRQLRNKLEIQLETNSVVWKRSNDELELKHQLADDINQRISIIQAEANGESSEAVQYFQEEISRAHAENERLLEENQHMATRIEELKQECQLLRDEDMYGNGMEDMDDIEEDGVMDMTN